MTGSCPIERVVRILGGAAEALDAHARSCGDRVIGVALHPHDHDRLCTAEVWGLPVLAWDEVHEGGMLLLCEANCVLIPDVGTVEELLDRWTYRLDAPA